MMLQGSTNNVNLGEIVRLSLPMNTEVYSELDLSQRLVNWSVVLTDLTGVGSLVKLGDLALLPASVQRKATDTELKKAIGKMAASASGLVLFHKAPEAIVAAAEAAKLPLIVVRGTVSVRDVHQSVSLQLVDHQTQVSERGMQLYRRLSEMSREGQGLTAMTEMMSKLTGNIVVVQDKRLEVRAISRPLESPLAVDDVQDWLSQRENLPAALRNRKAAAKTRQSSWHQVLPLDNVARLISPIVSGDRARGYLSVVGPASHLDLLDTLTVEQGAAACALEMAKAKAISEAKKALRGNFLEGLLAGTLPESEIDRLSGRLDHNTSPPHVILTFAWAGEKRPTPRRLETVVNWLVESHSRSALVHVFADEHICVFHAMRESDSDLSTARELARRINEQVETEFPEARLVSGMSGPALSLKEWPATYRQAVQAMQLGQRLNLGKLVEYNSLGIYQLLAQLDNIPAVDKFARQIIGPLADYDERHRSNLVQTIEAYFNHHGNISQTAESLFIHRNTLLYRLERIQELTDQNLDKADTRLSMHLALKLWQLNRGRTS